MAHASRHLTVCLTGPESSGKTTLARALAQSLSLPLVSEVARELLTPGEPYKEADLQHIAVAQQRAEQLAIGAGGAVLDTDVLVIAVWWRQRFAASARAPWPQWLDELLHTRKPRQYLLCAPDMPWEPDPLRESPADRERLFGAYAALLAQNPFPWRPVRGAQQDRLRDVMEWLD